ncbi:YggT family protein [Arcanobacterium haemolyticum]|nr:YggT family protein [Arcanobacterium haemolyticum]
MHLLFQVLALICTLYTFVLLGRVIFDIVGSTARDWSPTGGMLVVANIVYKLTDPPLRLLNRFVPPLRLGAIQLDVGFLILFIAVQILHRVFATLALQ